MALKMRNKIVLLKLEATYGVDPGPTGAADAVLATNVEITPMEGSDVGRELDLPFLAADPTIPTELYAKLSFDVEIVPSGVAGTAPAWGPLLRACGCAETIAPGVSVTYNPVSENHESAYSHLMIANTLYAIGGIQGNVTLNYTAQGIPKFSFDMTGLFIKPTEAVRPTPDLSGFRKPQVVSSANTPTFTIDAIPFVMRSASLDLGNQVENRFLVGAEQILITGRSEVFETTLEAVPITTFDPYQHAIDQSGLAVDLVHGTGAGNITTLNIPSAQMQRPQGLANAQDVKEWPLRMVPQYVAGNDQWTLTLT